MHKQGPVSFIYFIKRQRITCFSETKPISEPDKKVRLISNGIVNGSLAFFFYFQVRGSSHVIFKKKKDQRKTLWFFGLAGFCCHGVGC